MGRFKVSDPAFLPPQKGEPGQSIKGDKGNTGPAGKSFRLRGKWNRRTEYEPLDIVEWEGSSYAAVDANRNREPGERSAHWQLMAAKGEPGKEGSTTVIRHGSPRIVQALERLNEIEQQLGGSGESIPATADVVMGKGQVVFASGDERVDLAQADALATSVPVGVTTEAAGENEIIHYVSSGVVTNDAWSLTAGNVYFLSSTVAGEITDTAPSNPGEYVIIVGTAISPTRLLVEIHRSYLIGP